LLQQTRAAFEDSLVKLKTNYVDMVLLHAPGCWEGMCEPDLERGTYQDAWRALEDLYSENQIRAIGVSNFNLELLTKLAEESDFEIHNVQVRAHPSVSYTLPHRKCFNVLDSDGTSAIQG
jgi:diketogulonate reductase-like aldo/keto reductase